MSWSLVQWFLLASPCLTPFSEGDLPRSRCAHAAVVLEAPSRMLLFGGVHFTGRSTYFGDSLIFDFISQRWTLLSPLNPPHPRAQHTLVHFQSSVVVFGGYAYREGRRFYNDLHILTVSHGPTLRAESVVGTLAADMRTLLETGDLSDISLIAEDDTRPIRCHRCILTVRCPKFGAMLRSDHFQESSQPSVHLPINRKVLLILLEYIYTGS
jgi:hypothetical protein